MQRAHPLRSQRLSVLTLFEPAYLRRTLLSTTPWFLMDIAAYGVGLFTPALLAALHLGAAPQNVLAQTDRLASGTGIVDIFLLIGFLLGAWRCRVTAVFRCRWRALPEWPLRWAF
ncbi:hypothetical protein [Caldilinea sp.]|uniref:hypothetical protein n=1 Tax=Caldilinea sp. TaxID=2293560 RepID=UPI0021DE6E71|nr:hypothetical protein [Caldilinea sp.]GIV68235.1 MAG: hypothetical protein KatS3mg048_1097 [Caldilinea sp.]